MRRCAVIKEESVRAIQRANALADLIELRLDLMPNLTVGKVKRLRSACKRPVIFTGGECFLSLKPDYADVPDGIDTGEIARIRSWHDFETTPEDLMPLFAQPAAFYKVATMAHSTLDALRMLVFVKKHKVLGLCMGEAGQLTRLLAPIVGAPFMYAPLDERQRTAPGQLLLDELPTVDEKTALYGLIGDPVSQSPGVRLHNTVFRFLGVNALYVNLRLTPDELPCAFPLIKELGFQGLSVTRPHKEAIGALLDEALPIVNTVTFGKHAVGTNTDGVGALAALERVTRVKGKQITILGRGATAKVIAAHLTYADASVSLIGRHDPLPSYDILINATPTMPIQEEALLSGKVVMDVRLDDSPLLAAAKRRGCQVIEGMEMWMGQAKEQLCTWLLPQN